MPASGGVAGSRRGVAPVAITSPSKRSRSPSSSTTARCARSREAAAQPRCSSSARAANASGLLSARVASSRAPRSTSFESGGRSYGVPRLGAHEREPTRVALAAQGLGAAQPGERATDDDDRLEHGQTLRWRRVATAAPAVYAAAFPSAPGIRGSPQHGARVQSHRRRASPTPARGSPTARAASTPSACRLPSTSGAMQRRRRCCSPTAASTSRAPSTCSRRCSQPAASAWSPGTSAATAARRRRTSTAGTPTCAMPSRCSNPPRPRRSSPSATRKAAAC